MKLRTFSLLALLAVAALAVAACQQTQGTRTARLIGTHDLVLVSQNATDENDQPIFGTKTVDKDEKSETYGKWLVVGTPSKWTYVTSADTNELRLLVNYTEQLTGRTFKAAPNPLETLSIPVLDRPTLLAVDEGRNAEGSRVTGNYVYAARPGGAEVSVVSVQQNRQLNGRPFSTPAPVTAISAFMEVDTTAPILMTPMPANTNLYLATWDGDFAAVYRATLPLTSEPTELHYDRLLLVQQSPITAMLVVAPLSTRTLDGAPFCATTACIAISTRVNSGASGQTFMFDPATGRQASLAFSGPLRKLVSSSNGGRIYGVLDEQSCGGPACGGVVAVDVVAAVGSVFPASRDATGALMPPLRTADGLITGLAVGYLHINVDYEQRSGSIAQTKEQGDNVDGGATGTLTAEVQDYVELGAFASSSGVITFFSGLAGSIIDYDARRTTVTSASVRLPGELADGGFALFAADGGVLGSNVTLTVEGTNSLDDTFRKVNVLESTEDATWTVDISDGYLQTQLLAFITNGQIPGLVNLATTANDGIHLLTGGFEGRAAVGDIVRFESGTDATGFVECGRSTIATIGSGFIEVADSPAGCDSRSRFSVRAAGTKYVVAVAEIEGYLGRFAPGETLTYNRPYILLTAKVVAQRTALTVNIPTEVPRAEGSSVNFAITGFIVPYQVSLDTVSLSALGNGGCSNTVNSQVVIGNMVMDRLPTFSQADPLAFNWSLMAVVPSGNSMLELSPPNAHAGVLTGTGLFGGIDAICRR